MKILVTGANGMLAKEVKEKFAKGNEIIATDVSELDITNEKAVMEYVENTKPEYIINCAAYTAVDKASRYNIPVMGVTAVGKQMARDARYFGLASRICAENGANIVKTYYCEGFEKVAAACPVPVVIAGGKKLPEKEALELCYNAINDGAAGVDMGRNVFQSESPAAMIQAVHAVVHDGLTPEQGFEMFQDLSK